MAGLHHLGDLVKNLNNGGLGVLNIYECLVLSLLEPFHLKVPRDILYHNFVNLVHAFKNVFKMD